MRTVLALLVVLLPGLASAASFSHQGSMLLSGHFAYQSNEFEATGGYTLDESEVAFGPAFSVFLWKRVALRLSPGFTVRDQTWNEAGAKRTQTLSVGTLALGPSVYLPISRIAFFTAGAEAGLQMGSLKGTGLLTRDVDADGYTLGFETGLAFLVNDSGVIELLASWDQRHTEFSGAGNVFWEEDEGGFGLGFRLGIAL